MSEEEEMDEARERLVGFEGGMTGVMGCGGDGSVGLKCGWEG